MVEVPAVTRRIDHLVVHCAATTPDKDIGVVDIDKWHRARGFNGIGYHFVVRRDGSVEVGRPLSVAGAHVVGWNAHSVGICLVGGVNAAGKAEANFTPEQYASLFSLLSGLKGQFPQAEVMGHRDFPNVLKDCPSFNVKEWWAARN